MHQECLQNLNNTLIELFGTSEVEVPASGIVEYTGANGVMQTATVPICNLQKELDEVRRQLCPFPCLLLLLQANFLIF